MKKSKKKAKKYLNLDPIPKSNKKEKKKNARELLARLSTPAKFPGTYGLGGNANYIMHSDENGTVWHLDLNTGTAKRVTFV